VATVAGTPLDTDRPLREEDVDPDPIVEFHRWLALAWDAGEPQANAMALATVDADGAPQARMVLLNLADARGFTFYTNYESAKGVALAAEPRASLVFYWPRLHRSVRVSGTVARTAREESEAYWSQRPVGSRFAAAASAQSRVLTDRRVLDHAVAELERREPEGPPLPEFWGGYRLTPSRLELWQGRRNRLHDRLLYTLGGDGRGWRIRRLSP
jgi:pyridoxamine 5'-phosphate oxidase